MTWELATRIFIPLYIILPFVWTGLATYNSGHHASITAVMRVFFEKHPLGLAPFCILLTWLMCHWVRENW